jgi:hypothetical protein
MVQKRNDMKKVYKEGEELMHRINKNLGYNISMGSRLTEVVSYRQAFMVFLRFETTLGVSDIGKLVKRDHSTVLHAEKNHMKHMLGETNKSDAYRVAWENVTQLANTGKEFKEEEYTEGMPTFSLNVSLRKKVHNLERRVKDYIMEITIVKSDNKKLKEKMKRMSRDLHNDPTIAFDKGPLVKQVEHNWEFTREKPQVDNFTIAGIKYF